MLTLKEINPKSLLCTMLTRSMTCCCSINSTGVRQKSMHTKSVKQSNETKKNIFTTSKHPSLQGSFNFLFLYAVPKNIHWIMCPHTQNLNRIGMVIKRNPVVHLALLRTARYVYPVLGGLRHSIAGWRHWRLNHGLACFTTRKAPTGSATVGRNWRVDRTFWRESES